MTNISRITSAYGATSNYRPPLQCNPDLLPDIQASQGFNISSVAITLVLAALYATWW